MIFKSVDHKVQDVKTKRQLAQLGKKAHQTRTVFELNARNERVLQELVFAGDTAKHVF
jgi:phage-related minor tail protein